MRNRVVPALLLSVALAACRAGPDTAQGVAERFLDEHYVRMDLGAAKQYCTGVALQKVEEESRLVGEQRIDESTRKPHVAYRLKEKASEEEDSASFLYEGTVRVEGADTFSRRWLVTTRRQPGGAWKVSNFSEYE